MPTIKANIEDNVTITTNLHCKVCGGPVVQYISGKQQGQYVCENCDEYYFDHAHEQFDPWRPLLDEFVRERIRNYYNYGASYDSGLYNRVLEEMKDKIRKILVEDE